MGRETSGSNFNAKPRTAIGLEWCRLVRRCVANAANRVARYKLELALGRYRRTAVSLRSQIVNDVEALAYVHHQQHLAKAKLKELRA
jgi:hypothetical protein